MEDRQEWTGFLESLRELVNGVQSRDVNNFDSLVLMQEKINFALRGLGVFSSIDGFIDIALALCENIINLSQQVTRDINQCHNSRHVCVISAEKERSTKPGRPKFFIPEDVLLYFRDLGFNWKEIASCMKVSRWTISRRVEELGLKERTGYSIVSNDELDRLILEFKSIHGIAGGRSMAIGFLKSRNYRVQQRRVAESLVRVDPSNSRLRWACVIKRRKYSVPTANSLWHIDGHHSLINWGFVIHGAIDGYSRMVVFLRCSINNLALTVANLFDIAILRCGCPSRVRTDKGGENTLVWERMLEIRGSDRGSFIAGSSVHNQRIERLWRDVWTYVTSQFYYTFQAMETQGILNMDDPRHVFVLHFVFLPRINEVIEQFSKGWNRHPLRTEKTREGMDG